MIDARQPKRRRGCRAWSVWHHRTSLDNRRAWKTACSVLLLLYARWYLSRWKGAESLTLLFMGACFVVKLLLELWLQHALGPLYVLFYAVGMPACIAMFGLCTVANLGCEQGCPPTVDVELPHRELFALAAYLFGSCCSLGFECSRLRWKARPENRGRLYTAGLASYCVHPNYRAPRPRNTADATPCDRRRVCACGLVRQSELSSCTLAGASPRARSAR